MSDKPILDIMQRQIEANTSYRVQLSASAAGDAPLLYRRGYLGGAQAAAAAVSLNATYVRSKSADTLGDTQTRLMLYRADEKLSTLTLSGRGDRQYISGDVLGEQVLSIPRDANALSMMLFPAGEAPGLR